MLKVLLIIFITANLLNAKNTYDIDPSALKNSFLKAQKNTRPTKKSSNTSKKRFNINSTKNQNNKKKFNINSLKSKNINTKNMLGNIKTTNNKNFNRNNFKTNLIKAKNKGLTHLQKIDPKKLKAKLLKSKKNKNLNVKKILENIKTVRK